MERQIRKSIENALKCGYSRFVVFPYGYVGRYVHDVLTKAYGINHVIIVDNHLCDFNDSIRSILDCKNVDFEEYAVIISTTDIDMYEKVLEDARSIFPQNNLFELDGMKVSGFRNYETAIGRHSYGPICKMHPLIESIGNFCSFSQGVRAVLNHETSYLSTHPIIAAEDIWTRISEIDGEGYEYLYPWFIPGISPLILHPKRSVIGNDVWLGEDVIITNGSDIGNGAIVGAGAVITRDIPDYAIAVGVPAKVIRYRYSDRQIEELNKIKWWDWDDNTICMRHEDFYLDVDTFINKYKAK